MSYTLHYNDCANYITLDALSDGSVTKLGTSTVGSTTRAIYWNAGVPAQMTSSYPAIDSDGNGYAGFDIIPSDSTGSTNIRLRVQFNCTAESGMIVTYLEDGSKTSKSFAFTSNLTNGSVTKVGTSTVGGSNKPIYLSSGTPTACNEFMPLSGNTFTGAAYAQTNTSYTIYQLRNIAFTTSTPSSLTNGYVCMVYS